MPVLLVAATLTVFWPSLSGEFLHWDDYYNLVEVQDWRGLGWSNLRWMFTTFHNAIYEPLSWMAKGVQHQLWGMRPAGYHAYTLVLHVLNTLLVYGLAVWLIRLAARRPATLIDRGGEALLGSVGSTDAPLEHDVPGATTSPGLILGAGVAALLFSLHPLRVECVSLISAQPHVQAATFCLLAVLAYLRFAARRSAVKPIGLPVLALLLFAGSLLSKATAIGLPLVLLVLDVYPLRRWSNPRRGWLLLLEKAPFVLLSVAAVAVAHVARQHEQHVVVSLAQFGVGTRIAQAAFCMVFHLYKSLVPAGLMPIYPVLDDFDPSSWRFLGSVGFVVLLAGMSFTLRKRLPVLAAGGACYLFLLLPFLGLTNFPHFPVDRYTYLPLLAWTTVIGGGVCWLWCSPARASRALARPVIGICLLAAIVLGVAARRQTAVWQNSVVLYEHILHLLGDSPRRAAMLRRLGTSLDLAGRREEAIDRFTESLALNPQDVDAYIGLGLANARLDRWAEAVRANVQAYELAPDDWQVNFNLGTALVEAGEVQRGMGHYLRAIQLNPAAGDAYLNLANVLAGRGQYVQAARVLADGLQKTGGDWTVACRLAWMMAACPDPRVRNGAEAVKLAEAINERTGGTHPVVLDGLAAAYAEVGRFIEAVDVARQALERAVETGEAELAAEIRQRLVLYEAGQPYRDAVRAPQPVGGGATN